MTPVRPLTPPAGKRRGSGEDSIYFDPDRNRYAGAVSLGFGDGGRRLRRKVTGKTKAEVRRKLKELHYDLEIGVQSPADYTVNAAVDDWLADGLSGRSERTVQLYRDAVQGHQDRTAVPSPPLAGAAVSQPAPIKPTLCNGVDRCSGGG